MELEPPRHNPYSSFYSELKKLGDKGYTAVFTAVDENTMHDEDNNKYQSGDIVINEIHRFVDKENNSEKTAIYALATTNGAKGVLIDKYGEDEDEVTNLFLQRIDSHNPLH